MAHGNNIQGPGRAVLIYSSPGEAMSLSHKREAFSAVAHIVETLFTPRCINTGCKKMLAHVVTG